jgi:hypothetical protein
VARRAPWQVERAHPAAQRSWQDTQDVPPGSRATDRAILNREAWLDQDPQSRSYTGASLESETALWEVNTIRPGCRVIVIVRQADKHRCPGAQETRGVRHSIEMRSVRAGVPAPRGEQT